MSAGRLARVVLLISNNLLFVPLRVQVLPPVLVQRLLRPGSSCGLVLLRLLLPSVRRGSLLVDLHAFTSLSPDQDCESLLVEFLYPVEISPALFPES